MKSKSKNKSKSESKLVVWPLRYFSPTQSKSKKKSMSVVWSLRHFWSHTKQKSQKSKLVVRQCLAEQQLYLSVSLSVAVWLLTDSWSHKAKVTKKLFSVWALKMFLVQHEAKVTKKVSWLFGSVWQSTGVCNSCPAAQRRHPPASKVTSLLLLWHLPCHVEIYITRTRTFSRTICLP